MTEGKQQVIDFISDLNEIQEKYGMFIVTESEEPILVSLEPNANNHNILCYTNNVVIDELRLDLAEFDSVNIERIEG
jgi:hypothetical protein